MVSFLASFVLSFFPLDVLDEIWDLIEPVSEGFLTYSLTTLLDSISVHIGPSPRDREKEERTDR